MRLDPTLADVKNLLPSEELPTLSSSTSSVVVAATSVVAAPVVAATRPTELNNLYLLGPLTHIQFNAFLLERNDIKLEYTRLHRLQYTYY